MPGWALGLRMVLSQEEDGRGYPTMRDPVNRGKAHGAQKGRVTDSAAGFLEEAAEGWA